MIRSRAAHGRRFAVAVALGLLIAVLGALFCAKSLPGEPAAALTGTTGAAAAPAAGSGPAPAAGSGPVPVEEPVAAASHAADDGSPGCGRPQDKGTDPTNPPRAAASYDQGGAALAESPVPASCSGPEPGRDARAARGPTTPAPTPVELSVLRV